jgi:hypothetical protein
MSSADSVAQFRSGLKGLSTAKLALLRIQMADLTAQTELRLKCLAEQMEILEEHIRQTNARFPLWVSSDQPKSPLN